MNSFLSLVLLLSFLGVVVSREDLVVTSVRREIQLTKTYAEVTTSYKFRPVQKTSEFVVCLRRKQLQREAYFQGFLGSDTNGRKFEIGPVTGGLKVDVPEGLICQALKLPEGQKSDSEELEIYTIGVYIDVMSPLPAEIQQNELQRMLFRDTLNAIIPYPAEIQHSILFLPSEEILSKTMTEPNKMEGKMLSYGPFSNVEAFSVQPLSVHFVHNTQFIIIEKAVKEVQVSLWGNIYINEYYEIENAGAKLRGSWSRLDYQQDEASSSSVIREFRAEIPRRSDQFYYTDAIGNISTSKIINIKKRRIAALKPRYPLFGGWKTKFNFGYSTPLLGYLWQQPDTGNELHLQFSPSIHYPLIKDYELRIVLPDGSSEITHDQLPFPVDVGYETKYWYFDVVGRPVLVLRKQNIIDLHQISFKVKYSPSILSPYRKPILFFLVYFGLFSVYMIYLRLDLSIAGRNGMNKEKIKELLNQLKILFKQRLERFEEFKYMISELKNGQSSKKSTSMKTKIRSDLKDTHKKVQELKNSLRKLDYTRLHELEDLVAKDKELENHCVSFFDKKAGSLEDKTPSKPSRDEMKSIEKHTTNLTDKIQEAFDKLFRSG